MAAAKEGREGLMLLGLSLQDGVIQKDEFMQALFNTQPGNGNLFADRV